MALKKNLSEAEKILLDIMEADPNGVQNILTGRWHTLVDHSPHKKLQTALMAARKLLYSQPETQESQL
jgi:hypothetical protein